MHNSLVVHLLQLRYNAEIEMNAYRPPKIDITNIL